MKTPPTPFIRALAAAAGATARRHCPSRSRRDDRPNGWVTALLLCLGPLTARASDGFEGQSLFLNWENDGIHDTDRHYTQGAHVGYLSRDNAAAAWLQSLADFLPTVGFDNRALKWGVGLGQELYTPEDLDSTVVIEEDRPYAGWLFGSFSLIRRGPGPGEIPVAETLRLDLGMIGPEALGQRTQNFWHDKDSQGWDNQLDSEFAFAVRYDRRYLFSWPLAFDPVHWRFDAIPYGNWSVGTVDIHLGLGGMLRLGYNVLNEFEVPAERTTPHRWGAHVFAAGEGRWVIRNIFLDGNTFKDSHSVDKEPLVGDLKIGLTLTLKAVEITGAIVFLSDEFRQQATDDFYGTASVTLRF